MRSGAAVQDTDPLLLKDYDPGGLLTHFGTQRLIEIHLDCELSYDPMPPGKGEGFSLPMLSFYGEDGRGSSTSAHVASTIF